MFEGMFPNFRRAKKGLKTLLSHGSHAQFKDLTTEEINRINTSSQRYYEDTTKVPYWLNKPFADPEDTPWLLWRFGVLTAGLRLIPGIRILDFGCGTGWASVMLAQMGADVVGVDIAPRAMDLAQRCADQRLNSDQRARCKFATFDGFHLPFEDRSFDIVFLFEALHHLPNPVSMLKEFSRVLWEHGRLGFSEPGLGHEEGQHSAKEMEHGLLENDLDIGQLYNAGTAAGFRDLQLLIQGIHPGIFSLPMKDAQRFLDGASWMVPADFVRSAILAGPIGVFTKSTYRYSSQNPLQHLAVVQTAIQKLGVPAGSEFVLNASIQNPSDTVWLAAAIRGRGLVTLGASLYTASNHLLVRDFGRTALPHDVPAGGSIQLSIRLRAPNEPGEYLVRLDMVNEGVSWFAEKGSSPADIRLSATS